MRIQSLDLARGFTVFIMPSVHIVMLFSRTATQQSTMGHVLQFLAEGPGAQLFMMLMGISMTLSKKVNRKTVLKRTMYLLVAGYALNFLKFTVPLGLHLFPVDLLKELGFHNSREAMLPLFLMGDILQFAGIAYPLLYLVFRLPNYPNHAILLAILVAFLSPVIWDIHCAYNAVDYVFQLLGGHPPQTFFPVFPWIVYSLIGLSVGYYLQRDRQRTFDLLGIMGVTLLIVAVELPKEILAAPWLPFYRTGAVGTIHHMGIVLVWLYGCYWVTENVKMQQFFTLMQFLSKNITSIYIIQWVLIAWILPFVGYQILGMGLSTFCMLTISVASFYLAHLMQYFHGKKNI